MLLGSYSLNANIFFNLNSFENKYPDSELFYLNFYKEILFVFIFMSPLFTVMR